MLIMKYWTVLETTCVFHVYSTSSHVNEGTSSWRDLPVFLSTSTQELPRSVYCHQVPDAEPQGSSSLWSMVGLSPLPAASALAPLLDAAVSLERCPRWFASLYSLPVPTCLHAMSKWTFHSISPLWLCCPRSSHRTQCPLLARLSRLSHFWTT